MGGIVLVSLVGAVIVSAAAVGVMWLLTVSRWKRVGKAIAWGFTASQYRLTRGGRSQFYFDLDLAATDPDLAGAVASWYADRIRDLQRATGDRIRRVAFIERDSGPVGALAMTSLIVERSGIPGVIVRPRRRIAVNAFKEKRPFHPGDCVVLVSDVITTGGSLLRAAEMLRERGASVLAAVVLVHRGNCVVEERLQKKHDIRLVYGARIQRKEDLVEGVLGELMRGVVKTVENETPTAAATG